jgi:hypothetical protein
MTSQSKTGGKIAVATHLHIAQQRCLVAQDGGHYCSTQDANLSAAGLATGRNWTGRNCDNLAREIDMTVFHEFCSNARVAWRRRFRRPRLMQSGSRPEQNGSAA